MTLTPPKSTRRLILSGIDWKTYSRLMRVFAERPGVRLAYDRGRLEIISPLPEHESDARFLGRLVVTLTEELNLTIRAGGSTTFRRRSHRRGLEPDDCYWIAHEPQVRGRRGIDLRVDPPPDLSIEADLTSRSLNRFGIYAALRVPEVWRFEHPLLTFHLLGADGDYAEGSHSLAFPWLTATDLAAFLNLRGPQIDENGIIRQFRIWVRQRIASAGSP